MKISKRQVRQIYQRYKETGEIPKLSNKRRPERMLTNTEKEIIEKAYNEVFLGARMLRYHIQRHYKVNISHNKIVRFQRNLDILSKILNKNFTKIHEYLLAKDYAKENKRKKSKRKRCRYERKHSLSLVHADFVQDIRLEEFARVTRKWFEYGGIQGIGYEDDASRRLLAIGEFTNATGKNSVEVAKEAEKEAELFNYKLLAINTDRGTQFYP